MKVSCLLKGIILLLSLTSILCVKFEQKSSSQPHQTYHSFLDPYEIYEVMPNKIYQMNRKIITTMSQDYKNIPQFIRISCQNEQKITIKKLSHHYISISQYKQDEQKSSTAQKLVRIYSINVNNYLFLKYQHPNPIQYNNVSSLLISEDNMLIGQSDMWGVSFNGKIIRRAFAKNQTRCYSGERSSSEEPKCFSLYLKDLGYVNSKFSNELSFKVFKDYSKMDQIKYLQIMPYFQSTFLLLVGGNNVIYTLLSFENSVDFIQVFESSKVNITGIYGLQLNSSALTFDNGSLVVQKGYQKNEKKMICKMEGVIHCKKLSNSLILCQFQDQITKILDYNCKIAKKIDLSSELLGLQMIGELNWELQQKYIDDKVINSIVCSWVSKGKSNRVTKSTKRYSLQIQDYKEDKYTNEIFSHNSLINFLQYRQKSADKFLQGIVQEFQDQENNCQIINDSNKDEETSLITINFTKPDWKICKTTINLTLSFVMQMDTDEEPQQPYQVYFCRMKTTQSSQKCIFGNYSFKEPIYLHKNSFYRMYILQNGRQSFNVTLVNIQKLQLEKVTNAFLIILACVLSIAIVIIGTILLKETVENVLIYLQLLNKEPQYHYPLNTLLLKIKINKLIKKGFMYYTSKIQNSIRIQTSDLHQQQLCCFCLETLISSNKSIELYCRHEYHAQCFEQWMRKQPQTRCPYCKRQFTSADMQDFQKGSSQFKQYKSTEQISIQ